MPGSKKGAYQAPTFNMAGRLRLIRAEDARRDANALKLENLDRDDLVELYLRCVTALASRPVEE